MRSPGITATVDGKNKTLYMKSVASIEKSTKPNLQKTFAELGIVDSQELVVADVTSPNSMIFKIKFLDVE